MSAKRRSSLRSGASILSPTAALRRRSLSRGILGGSRVWTAVAVVVWGSRFLRRVLGRQEIVVARESLKPGQTMTIRALAPAPRPSGRSRRGARAGASRS